jgi:ribosomal protein S18 acetylase RimI-like enzyme
MTNLKVSVLTRADWKVYKELRLLSLQDSPDSFGSTYAREVEFSNDEWISRFDSCPPGDYALPLIARLNGVGIGLAWGLRHNSEDQVAYVYQMWVSPMARGKCVGKLLINQITLWAQKSNLQAIILDVTTTNQAAINLYKSAGFKTVGNLEALRESSSLSTQQMRLEL